MKVKNFKELIAACVISQCMVMMPAAIVPAAEITPHLPDIRMSIPGIIRKKTESCISVNTTTLLSSG